MHARAGVNESRTIQTENAVAWYYIAMCTAKPTPWATARVAGLVDFQAL